MNDRLAASLVLMAAGIALAVYYFRLTRGQRGSLLQGLTGKAPQAPVAPRPSPSAAGGTGPIVAPPGRVEPPPAVDWLERQKQRFNEMLRRSEGIYRDLGIKPPYKVEPVR